MSISLLFAFALGACTPSASEPTWPIEVFWTEPPPENPDGFSIDNKCELSGGKLPPELEAAVDHAYKFCRNGPPLKALAALDALDATLVRFPKFGWRFNDELTWQRYRWHGKLAVLRNIPKLRPRDRCVGPVP
jgi:hypothetical protein